jgi:hypothetical protein
VVDVGRVDAVHPRVDRPAEQFDGGRFIDLAFPAQVGQTHGPETEDGNTGAGLSQRAVFHCFSLPEDITYMGSAKAKSSDWAFPIPIRELSNAAQNRSRSDLANVAEGFNPRSDGASRTRVA